MRTENKYLASQKPLTEYEYAVSLRRLANKLKNVCPNAAFFLEKESDLYARIEPRKPRVWWVKPETLEDGNYPYADPQNAGCIRVVESI